MIESLPDEISDMRLKELCIANNDLHRLPETLPTLLMCGCHLDARGNELESLPTTQPTPRFGAEWKWDHEAINLEGNHSLTSAEKERFFQFMTQAYINAQTEEKGGCEKLCTLL